MSSTRPTLPWKIRFYNSTYAFVLNLCRNPNGAVKRRLFQLLDIKYPPSKKPDNGVKSKDFVVDASHDLWFRLFVPTNPDSDNDEVPTIVYFHGGGYEFFSASSRPYHNLCRQISRDLSANVISVSYRLAPEHKCPAQYEDGFDVLKFIDENDCFGAFATVNLSRCFIAGDSAGGNLAHHLAVKASGHNFNRLNIFGIISILPFFGSEERMESELVRAPLLSVELTDWMWEAFLPEGANRDHPAVNVFGPNDSTDISGLELPPTIVIVGGWDILRDGGKRYYEGLKIRGKEAYLVEYPNAFHTFYLYPELPEYSLFIRDVKDFIQKY